MRLVNRFALFISQVLFSAITPFLLIPRIARMRVTRTVISFCFGRSYGNRYDKIIDSFQGRYGLAMAEGLAKAEEMAIGEVSLIVDCGTGTGFVTRQAAEFFPHSTFIAFDLLQGMLKQARDNCKEISTNVFHVQADVFSLPLADESADLILVQNTMPCWEEFARVCRPGGIVIYVDTAAGWIVNVAKRLIKKRRLFTSVTGRRVEMGFYLLAKKKAGGGDRHVRIPPEGETALQRLTALLRCPVDKSNIALKKDRLICPHGHEYSFCNDFPIMLAKIDQPGKQTGVAL